MYSTNNKVVHSSISKIQDIPMICTMGRTRCPNGQNEINNKNINIMILHCTIDILIKLNTKNC